MKIIKIVRTLRTINNWVFGLFGIGFLILVLIVVMPILGNLFDNSFNGEITGFTESHYLSGNILNSTHKYKVNERDQFVIGLNEDGSIWDKYTKCAVVSRKNWQCEYNDGSGEFGFENGTYWDYYTKNDADKPINRFVYIYRELKKLIVDGNVLLVGFIAIMIYSLISEIIKKVETNNKQSLKKKKSLNSLDEI